MLNLLLITEDKNKHHVLIIDFNNLMYNKTKHKCRKHFCTHCLQCFSSENVLNNHKTNCIVFNGKQGIKMPAIRTITSSNSKTFINRCHYILMLILRLSEKIQGCLPNDIESYTKSYQKHTDCNYGYKVVCCYDDKYTI